MGLPPHTPPSPARPPARPAPGNPRDARSRAHPAAIRGHAGDSAEMFNNNKEARRAQAQNQPSAANPVQKKVAIKLPRFSKKQ